MSGNSSSKVHHRVGKALKKAVGHGRPHTNWRMLFLLPLWVAVAFVASNLFVEGLLYVLAWLHISLADSLRPTILQTLLSILVYAVAIALVIGVPYAVKKRRTSLEVLGLQRLPSWIDIGLSPVGFIVYSLIITIILALLTAWLPQLPLDQAQDVGFNAFGSRTDNYMAFITLVVMAPIAEETLFRGYLYGKLKRYVPVLWAALATSLLFALAHLQLNVGIDVFVLSMVLCVLRSLTGSIWAGVLVHMIKNAVAYYILFVAPIIGG